MDGQTIYARVTSQIDFGCFDISEFQLQIGIRFNCPNFFTPNGDGIHDYWNIPQQEFVSDIRIQIFDRYGKLLKVLKNSNLGWDGNYNGNQAPSSDYWFKVDYLENGVPKEKSGHFALKR
ncbi:MAG: T9SS type B sorting domain-containing protein [Flavobacteriaceae bacterium]|nr:T9SS type B sorting domain-containing protein [Flavobacteriaceae bacterium]